MALNKEVWIQQILEGFYPNDSFLTKPVDYSQFVDNHKLHIASAGIDPEVLVNNTTYPIGIVGREDDDNVIPPDKFETVNTLVRRPEAIEYSYQKLESVVGQHRATLRKSVATKAAHAYGPQVDALHTPIVTTTGAEYGSRHSHHKDNDFSHKSVCAGVLISYLCGENNEMGRVLAIDYGTKRTGIAVSDPLRLIAGGLETVPTHRLLPWLKQYATAERVDIMVVGRPARLDGQPSASFAQIEPFFRRLRKEFPDTEIVWHDERFTSVMAQRAIIEGGVRKMARRDKALVDKVSAAIILESYLESREYKERTI